MTKDHFIYGLTACGCLLKDGKTWYEHNELIKCFEDLGLFEQEPRKITLEDVKGYCEPRCLTIVSNELYYELTHPKIKALEQEPTIDKIRAEIQDTGAYEQEVNGKTEFVKGITYCLNIIDKYKAESEG